MNLSRPVPSHQTLSNHLTVLSLHKLIGPILILKLCEVNFMQQYVCQKNTQLCKNVWVLENTSKLGSILPPLPACLGTGSELKVLFLSILEKLLKYVQLLIPMSGVDLFKTVELGSKRQSSSKHFSLCSQVRLINLPLCVQNSELECHPVLCICLFTTSSPHFPIELSSFLVNVVASVDSMMWWKENGFWRLYQM